MSVEIKLLRKKVIPVNTEASGSIPFPSWLYNMFYTNFRHIPHGCLYNTIKQELQKTYLFKKIEKTLKEVLRRFFSLKSFIQSISPTCLLTSPTALHFLP